MQLSSSHTHTHMDTVTQKFSVQVYEKREIKQKKVRKTVFNGRFLLKQGSVIHIKDALMYRHQENKSGSAVADD